MARILIVDDEEMSAASLRAGLEPQAHLVMTCQHGAGALEILLLGKVDLVIIDILTPGADGLGFISSARRSSMRIPIIALSANPFALPLHDRRFDYWKVARKPGADAILRKPIQWGEPRVVVDMCLRRSRTKATIRL